MMLKLNDLYFLVMVNSLVFTSTKAQIKQEDLFYSTVKISCDSLNQRKTTGTAFFFIFTINNTPQIAIVTNKHVIENSTNGEILFNEDVINPSNKSAILLKLKDFENLWIKHPTEDIAILPLNLFIDRIRFQTRKRIRLKCYSESQILTGQNDTILNGLQNILMIGYPKGFHDTINNIPIIRQGYTATPIHINYNKERKFLADIPTFSGSSGSPVIYYNNSGVSYENGGWSFGMTQFFLLGIASESKEYKNKNSEIWMPLNLAIVIKAAVILDLKEMLGQKVLMPNSYYFFTSKITDIIVVKKR